MAAVSIKNLHKDFSGAKAVDDFSLDISDGELVAFLGPSGCGKTTTLRMVAGFMEPTGGEIWIGDKEVSGLAPELRNTGMVFQRYALFPHMTVAQNVAFGLQMRKVSKSEQGAKVKRALDMVRMSQLAERFPRQLSGGQQQRVAIARALVIQPDVFLLDEPLSNLDAKLRVEVREEIRTLQQSLGLTTIFVTHDQEEALAISDRVAVMHDGKIQQIGTAKDLYEKPVNPFVANFLGKMNFFNGKVHGGSFVTSLGDTFKISSINNKFSVLGIRPERVKFDGFDLQKDTILDVGIDKLSYLGPIIELGLSTRYGEKILAHIPNNSVSVLGDIQNRDRLQVGLSVADYVVF